MFRFSVEVLQTFLVQHVFVICQNKLLKVFILAILYYSFGYVTNLKFKNTLSLTIKKQVETQKNKIIGIFTCKAFLFHEVCFIHFQCDFKLTKKKILQHSLPLPCTSQPSPLRKMSNYFLCSPSISKLPITSPRNL